MGPKGNGDMQAAKRDWNAPPTRDLYICALCALEWTWQTLFWINR